MSDHILTRLNQKINPYFARRITPADHGRLFLLHGGNGFYNACLQGEKAVTRRQVLKGLAEIPPGATAAQKLYLGVFGGEALLGCMDYIEGYPDKTTVYLGLLMIDAGLQRQGLGAMIANAFLNGVRESGYRAVRLGVLARNTPALLFWKKQGFAEIDRKPFAGQEVIIMEAGLRETGRSHSKKA